MQQRVLLLQCLCGIQQCVCCSHDRLTLVRCLPECTCYGFTSISKRQLEHSLLLNSEHTAAPAVVTHGCLLQRFLFEEGRQRVGLLWLMDLLVFIMPVYSAG